MREEWKAAAYADLRIRFPAIWDAAFAEKGEHTFTLFGPSCYVLDADGSRVVIDPCLRFPWMTDQIAARIRNDFARVDAVVLTHAHEDHFDTTLLSMLRNCLVPIVVPEFFTPEQLASTSLPDTRFIRVRAGERIRLGRFIFTAYRSAHFRPSGSGIDEMGYLIETSRQRMLFPCDVRDYNPAKLPPVGEVDTLFLHVWLGTANALNLPCEPFLSDTVRFVLATGARQVVLAHLMELARTLPELWTYTHAGLIADALIAARPDINILLPRLGVRLTL